MSQTETVHEHVHAALGILKLATLCLLQLDPSAFDALSLS
jgi:hypothetical protein